MLRPFISKMTTGNCCQQIIALKRKIGLAKIFRSSKINLLLRCKTNLLQIGKCHQELNIWNVYGYYVSSLMWCWELNYYHFDNIIQRSRVTNVPRDAGGLVWKINLCFLVRSLYNGECWVSSNEWNENTGRGVGSEEGLRGTVSLSNLILN